MRFTRHYLIPLSAVALAGGIAAVAVNTPRVPRMTVGEQPNGVTVISSNQTLTPIGGVVHIAGARPKDLALSPDGKTLAVLAQGQVLFYNPNGTQVARVPANVGPLGLAWTPDGGALYVSGENGVVTRIDAADGTYKEGGKFTLVSVPSQVADPNAAASGRTNSAGGMQMVPVETLKGDPQITGLAVSPDGKRLYAAMSIRNAVAVVDTATMKTISMVPVGAAPYRVAISPDGTTLFVANRGEIARVGEPSEPSANTPVRVNKVTDASAGGSISFINTDTLAVDTLRAGEQPAGMAVSRDGGTLYVASSNDDRVLIVDARRRALTGAVSVRPAQDPGFGQMPTTVALSDDERTLYAACGGGNAVAVVNLPQRRVAGYLPTGWFPIAIAQRNGEIFVASSKGYGSRNPNKDGAYNVHATIGTVQFIQPRDWTDLRAQTARVAKNNRWGALELPARKNVKAMPVPARVGEPSVFKHVVYIIKENHTYDLDLGDMTEGNGDKKLCIFPEEVTPNEHRLAREFVLLDNTYTSGTNSADGHQWTDSALCNAYQEQNYSSNARSYPYDGGDPLAGSPAGYLWTQAIKAHKTFRDYGEFVNRPKIVDPKSGGDPLWVTAWQDYKSGANTIQITAQTDTAALRPYLHPHYIGFPINISDQWRADQYLADLRRFQASGKMPQLSILLLPANHTSGTAPTMPTPRAQVADNDLALGRIIEAISKSRFWKDTLIMVVEDDSQFGVDHVDGHRTLAFCVSPYTKRHAVISQPYNHTSILRTMELVLGLPAMNRFDRTAQPMTACFTAKPDLRPYVHAPNRVRLDELNPLIGTLTGERRRLAQASAKMDWSNLDRADPETVARAIWSAQRPGTPFPKRYYHPDGDED